jgi:EAL domain-containing protein (putative c-di-GMP-specific phosphodiesterase class I)
VRASIGVANWDGSITDHEEILRNADVAMYIAKGDGKNRVAVFEPSMKEAVVRRHALKLELERAVDRHEFTLHYQPIVDLESSRIVALEALVRWTHTTDGMVPPDVFIPLAEETGLIVPLGRWVLRTACMQLRQWQDRHPSCAEMSVTVNVSGKQLLQPAFVEEASQALRDSGIDPRHLVLEITESVMMEHTESTLARLGELRALGVRLAVDDFGTGYSSLSSLQYLPVDIFKLAKPFVDDLANGNARDDFVDAIVKLGASMQLGMVAEGIELQVQRQKLLRLGCGMGQGYFFGRPMDAARVEAILGADAHEIRRGPAAAIAS